MYRPANDAAYSNFISAMFVALFICWVDNSDDIHALITEYPNLKDQAILLARFSIAQSVLLLPCLICVWWWYQMHLSRYAPASTFMAYSYDFLILSAFGVAVYNWKVADKFFFLTILFAGMGMVIRYFFAYRPVRTPGFSKKDQILVLLPLLILGIGILYLGYDLYVSQSINNFHHYSLITAMVLGMLITLVAALQVDGSRILHPVSVIEHPDKLGCVLPPDFYLNNGNLANIDFINQILPLSRNQFKNELSTKTSPELRYTDMSNVHSPGDTDVHAWILALPSLHSPEEISAKTYITYFSHWIDDVLDRGIGKYYLRDFDGFMYSHRRIVSSLKARFPNREEMVDLSLKRLYLGAKIFAFEEQNAETDHSDLILELLSNDKDWKCKDRLCEHVRKRDKTLVSMTTKTIQELWFAIEDHDHPFGLTFLYSLLFAPALYYHDQDEEYTYGEVGPAYKDREVGALSRESLNERLEEIIKMINVHGESDPRYKLRDLQVKAVGWSFQSVLPEWLREFYAKGLSR